MKEFSLAEETRLLEILEAVSPELLKFNGVHYLDIGYRFIKQRPTDQLAIRVHVKAKKSPEDLDPSQILPQSIKGVPIDILQCNPKKHRVERDSSFNPVLGGVAVGNTRYQFFGTLGAIVYDPIRQQPLGLSNHHVLVGESGHVGDEIAQPPSGKQSDVIGSLNRWDEAMDCAVFTFNNQRLISPKILGISRQPSGHLEPRIGLRVMKSGRTTGVTFGIIDGISQDELSVIPDPNRLSPRGEISDRGDSGSVWLETSSLAAVGLHYAGETDPSPAAERAMAKRISKVINCLGISFGSPGI